MLYYLKFIIFSCLLSLSLVTFAQTDQEIWQSAEESNMLFDIKAYNELRKKYPNQREIVIDLSEGETAYVRISGNYYVETIEKHNGYYHHTRFYFKPSGNLMSARATFYTISVGTTKLYNESGELTRSIYHTPDDWADRLVTLMKKDYGLDLSSNHAFRLIKIKSSNQKDGLIIQHLDGKGLCLETYDPIRKFILLDFESLKFVAKGEMHAKIPDEIPKSVRETDSFPRTIDTYYVDGKPFNFKW